MNYGARLLAFQGLFF
jgi:hypothetical protein